MNPRTCYLILSVLLLLSWIANSTINPHSELEAEYEGRIDDDQLAEDNVRAEQERSTEDDEDDDQSDVRVKRQISRQRYMDYLNKLKNPSYDPRSEESKIYLHILYIFFLI